MLSVGTAWSAVADATVASATIMVARWGRPVPAIAPWGRSPTWGRWLAAPRLLPLGLDRNNDLRLGLNRHPDHRRRAVRPAYDDRLGSRLDAHRRRQTPGSELDLNVDTAGLGGYDQRDRHEGDRCNCYCGAHNAHLQSMIGPLKQPFVMS